MQNHEEKTSAKIDTLIINVSICLEYSHDHAV